MNKSSRMYSPEEIKRMCEGEPFSLKQIQNRLLEMLTEFDKFCKEHEITYFLSGGTLLGAIRHKGFIPWDDDVDILVPRADYENLLTYCQINGDLDIVSYNNPGDYYHPYPYCNIADRRTVMYEHHTKALTGKGLFLDIFPLDAVPEDEKERKSFYKKLTLLRYIKGLPMNPYRKVSSFKDLIMNICSFAFEIFDEVKMTRKIDSLAAKYKDCSSNLCAELFVGPLERLTWPSDDYKKVLRVQFEEREFDIPANYDAILTTQYGDYMTPPPLHEQNAHHGVDVYNRKTANR